MTAVARSAQQRRYRRLANGRSQQFLGARVAARVGYRDEDLHGILEVSKPIREDLPLVGAGCFLREGMIVPRIGGGAGFTSYNDIINALTVNGKGQYLQYAKAGVGSSATSAASLWGSAGIPVAGVFGTALTARTIDRTTTGSLTYANPVAPALMYLLGIGGGSTVAFGTLILYDRLAEYPLNGTVTSGTFSSVTLPARDAAGGTTGAGVLPFVENDITGATTGSVTLTLTYTNQANTGSQSTGAQTMVAGIVGRILMDRIWIPLATGDTGVRTIQSYVLSATATSTKLTVVLARPLAFVPIMAANAYVERDTVLQIASLPRLYDGTALAFAAMANTTTTGVTGRVTIAEN